MAVVGIAREKRGSPGALRQTGTGFSVSREFIVETDDPADDAIVVDRAVGLPQLGNFYQTQNSTHAYLFCVRRSLRRLNDKSRFWIVECEYETPDPNSREQQKNDQQAPEFELPIIRGGTWSELRDVVKSVDDTPKPIVNGAGEAFRPHPKEPAYFPALYIQRNEPITSPVVATQLAYTGKTNSDTFWGFPAGTWLCSDITWELNSKVLAQGLQLAYLVVSYQFQAKDTWDLELLNIGHNFWTGNTTTAGQKELDSFESIKGWGNEGFLDDDGYPVGTPEYLTFKTKRQAAFAGLQLPQSPIAAVPP